MTSSSDDQQPADRKIQKNGLANEVAPEFITSGSASLLPTFKTKPTSFFAVAQSDTIRGEFGIDPSIHIPSSLLPPLRSDETECNRVNLSLQSWCNSVHADIWLLPGERAQGNKAAFRRTNIALNTGYSGSIHARVRTLDGAAPFALNASGRKILLALPQSFQGLLLFTTYGRPVSLSDALVRGATQLSQGNTQRYFVGDVKTLRDEPWMGDWVELDAWGSIRVNYVDEADAQSEGQGWLRRLFRK